MPQQNFQICFNDECPDIKTLMTHIESSLEQHQISDHYNAEEIIRRACHHYTISETVGSLTEIHAAWLKTRCIEIVWDLGQAYNRKKFDQAIKALFDNKNPDALSFCASIKRMLRQFRLSGAYEVREIIAEAYTRGVKKIDSGERIDIPLAWLRTTCLNVVRDFQREQFKADNPKLDGDAWSPGDVVFSELVLQADLLCIQQAVKTLTPKEQQLLTARIFRRLSWQEIGELLRDENERPLKPGTARQRGSRALKKLRQSYEEIRDTIAMPEQDVDSTLDWETGWDWD